MTTEFDVDAFHFADTDLIEALEDRGYTVLSDYELNLTTDEIDELCDMLSREKPGTVGYNIREKLRKR